MLQPLVQGLPWFLLLFRASTGELMSASSNDTTSFSSRGAEHFGLTVLLFLV